jgi:hypothetical protein
VSLSIAWGSTEILRSGVAEHLTEGSPIGAHAALVLSMAVGLLTTLIGGNRPPERLQLNRSRALRAARPTWTVAAALAMYCALGVGRAIGFGKGLVMGLATFVVAALVTFGVAMILTSSSAGTTGVFDPRRLLRRCAARAIVVWFLTAIAVALGGWFLMRTAVALEIVGEFGTVGGLRSGSFLFVVPLSIVIWLRWLWWRPPDSLYLVSALYVAAVVVTWIGVLGGDLLYLLSVSASDWLLTGLAIGLIVAWGSGFAFMTRYAIARLLGVSAGVMPWRYVAYLEWASDALLLKRAGGGFQFFHGTLRAYLAAKAPVEARQDDV